MLISQAVVHPLSCPSVMIPQNVDKIPDLEELVDAFPGLRPSVTHITKTNKRVFRVVKIRSFQALT
jgi:hypothetical protein